MCHFYTCWVRLIIFGDIQGEFFGNTQPTIFLKLLQILRFFIWCFINSDPKLQCYNLKIMLLCIQDRPKLAFVSIKFSFSYETSCILWHFLRQFSDLIIWVLVIFKCHNKMSKNLLPLFNQSSGL